MSPPPTTGRGLGGLVLRPGETVLAVSDLSVAHGSLTALRDVSLSVTDGELVALIGANGAGKSSILRAVSGLRVPNQWTDGEITFLGRRIEREPAHRIASMGMAHVPQGRRMFPALTVEENLMLGAWRLKGDQAAVEADLGVVYGQFPVLAERASEPARDLGAADQQVLAVARALLGHPRLLLVDEPSLGLPAAEARSTHQLISALARALGVTVLVADQPGTAVVDVADYAYVLDAGVIVARGPVAEVVEHPIVRGANGTGWRAPTRSGF